MAEVGKERHMGIAVESDQRASVELGPTSWRQSDVEWNLADLIDATVSMAVASTVCRFTDAVTGLIAPSALVKSREVLLVAEDGGLHRRCTSGHADLLTWAVARVWKSRALRGRLRDGLTYAEVWASTAGGEALACLPLARGSQLDGVIAVWLTAPSPRIAADLLARLTLAVHLWPRSIPAGVESDIRAFKGESAEILSPRQVEILGAMSEGSTNRQIARRIGFSESTVRLESMSIYKHFGVHSRGEAVRVARESGLL
jgi:DNA-binding CsgD family transcriptional regulator